jgi:hypothetical protein
VSSSSTTSEAEFKRLMRSAKLSHLSRDSLTPERILTEYFSTCADDLRVSTASGSERRFRKRLIDGISLATARGTDSEAQVEYFFEGVAAFVGFSRLTGRVLIDHRKPEKTTLGARARDKQEKEIKRCARNDRCGPTTSRPSLRRLSRLESNLTAEGLFECCSIF